MSESIIFFPQILPWKGEKYFWLFASGQVIYKSKYSGWDEFLVLVFNYLKIFEVFKFFNFRWGFLCVIFYWALFPVDYNGFWYLKTNGILRFLMKLSNVCSVFFIRPFLFPLAVNPMLITWMMKAISLQGSSGVSKLRIFFFFFHRRLSLLLCLLHNINP